MNEIQAMVERLDMEAGIGRIDLSEDDFGFVQRMQNLIVERGPEELYDTEAARIRQLHREKIGERA